MGDTVNTAGGGRRAAVTAGWQRSSFSGNTGEGCVELARHGEQVLLRESDSDVPPAPPVLRTSTRRLAALLAATRAGRFDGLPRPGGRT